MPKSTVTSAHPFTNPVEDSKHLRQRFGLAPNDHDAPLAQALDQVLNGADSHASRPQSVDVALVLHKLGVDETTLIATLLNEPRLRHTRSDAEIRGRFGKEVAQLLSSVHGVGNVRGCEHGVLRTPEQAERLRRMLLAMVTDIRAILITLAYRVQRLRNLRKENYDTRLCIARETLDIYAPVANRLGVGQLKWELEDLAFRYLEPQTYMRLAKALEESRIKRETYIHKVIQSLTIACESEGIKGSISGRPKHIYSIWRKMQRKNVQFEDLYDLRAVRLVVDKVSDCYAALGVVHTLWQPIPGEFDDYIANPKDNGYRSLHTAVVATDGRIIEVQIRTYAMHEFAERGVAAHWAYKEGGKTDSVMQRSISSLQRLLEPGNDDTGLLESFSAELFQDRVFVLTPSGEIQDLPQGATPLDFAYCIHTEVGHRCRGAKVNGKIVPLTTVLKSGDQVEVLTGKQSRPSRDWMNPHLAYLRTSRARGKVRQWFKHQDREINIQDGRTIIDRELQRLGVLDVSQEDIAKHFGLSSVEDLLADIGRGEIRPSQIAGAVQDTGLAELRLPQWDEPRRPPTAREGGDITIQGVGNLLTQIAQCCKPMPGDPVIGYITRGKGVAVHRMDCRNILNLSDDRRKRLIEVAWGSTRNVYPVDVRVEAFDRQGLLRDITAILSNEKINLVRANSLTNAIDQTVTMDLTLEITDTGQLSRLLDKFAQVPNVVEARRCAH